MNIWTPSSGSRSDSRVGGDSSRAVGTDIGRNGGSIRDGVEGSGVNIWSSGTAFITGNSSGIGKSWGNNSRKWSGHTNFISSRGGINSEFDGSADRGGFQSSARI